MSISIIAHCIMCCIVLYSCFCRARKSCEDVKLSVSFSFFVLGCAASFGLAAPFCGWKPDLFSLVLLFSISLVQVTTAVLWQYGTPYQFYLPGKAPNKRTH